VAHKYGKIQTHILAANTCRAASLLAAARYHARLRRFYNWCGRGNINPHSAIITQIADFLKEFLDKE